MSVNGDGRAPAVGDSAIDNLRAAFKRPQKSPPTHRRLPSGNIEADPTGKRPNEAGAKLDAGKPRPGLVLGSFARALMEVVKVGTFGAEKYSDNGWLEVQGGEGRYADAGMRHWLYKQMGEDTDPDSDLNHLAHEAWNALARLELELRRKENEQRG